MDRIFRTAAVETGKGVRSLLPGRPKGCCAQEFPDTSFLLIVIAVLAAAFVPTGIARAGQELFQDEIVRRDEQRYPEVRIEEDNWKFVRARKGPQATFPVPSAEVQEVIYGDADDKFTMGVLRVASGRYSLAIEKNFGPLLNELKSCRKVGGHPWPKQYCLYYLGVSHLRRGKPGDAAAALKYFERLVKEIPDSRFAFEAHMGIGDSHLVNESYDGAVKAYRKAQKWFEKMAGDVDVHESVVTKARKFALKAELRQAEAYDMKKDYPKAVSLYNRVALSSTEHPKIRFQALAGAVRANVSRKAYSDALRVSGNMIREGEREGHTEYLGGAFLSLADCYFAQYDEAQKKAKDAGRKAPGPEGLIVARYNYLRVATLYFSDRRAVSKARCRAALCYERLSRGHGNGEGGRARERAVRQYRLVVDLFPKSKWAGFAQKRLDALGVEKAEEVTFERPKPRPAVRPRSEKAEGAEPSPAAEPAAPRRRRRRKR